jgi:hypothetical protein
MVFTDALEQVLSLVGILSIRYKRTRLVISVKSLNGPLLLLERAPSQLGVLLLDGEVLDRYVLVPGALEQGL